MPNICFALLIGINNYPEPTPTLQGCLHDIAALAGYLRHRFTSEPSCLRLLKLTDAAATRSAIINGFRDHLGQAKAGDVALFAFSGHGSQVAAPPEIWDLEPDRCLETLVCFDSRSPGSFDLADKELALLIHDLAEHGPDVIVILDCCHSGTATRTAGAQTRMRGLSMDDRPRPWDSFLNAQIPGASRGMLSLPLVPQGRHVLISACEDRQVAMECCHCGIPRGALSAALCDTLASSDGQPTIRNLFQATAARMRTMGLTQSPQLEATHPVDLDRPFLGGPTPTARPTFTVRYDRRLGWVVDGGAIHGLLSAADGRLGSLALYPQEEVSRQPREPAFVARIAECLPHYSRLAFDGPEPGRDLVFAAIPQSLPPGQLAIAVSGAGEREALALRTLAEGCPFLRLCAAPSADILLNGGPGAYTLRWIDGRPISRHLGEPAEALAEALGQLEQIAYWRRAYLLASPTDKYLCGEAMRLELRYGDKLIWPQGDGASPQLPYRLMDGRWRWPTIEALLTNQGPMPLYCALLALSDDYTVANLLPGGCLRLDLGSSFRVRIGATISDTLWDAGICESTSYLKLISCTAPFDATLLERAGVSQQSARGAQPSASLELRTLRPALHIHDAPPADEWATMRVAITITRPAEAR